MVRTLSPEQRKAKQERDRARRAEQKALRESNAGTKASTRKAPKSTSPKASDRKPSKKERQLERELTARKKELDVSKIDEKRGKKMLAAIHELEREAERKRHLFELASQNRRAAKAELEEAEDALRKEINDQRFGAGPLFDPNAQPLTGASPHSVPEAAGEVA